MITEHVRLYSRGPVEGRDIHVITTYIMNRTSKLRLLDIFNLLILHETNCILIQFLNSLVHFVNVIVVAERASVRVAGSIHLCL